MTPTEIIKISLNRARMVTTMILADLSDDDLTVRSVPGANHIAWQLGHLIASEHRMMNLVQPGSMPPLPEGFAENHTKETSASDDRDRFLSKDEYLRLYQQQREATHTLIDTIDPARLDEPAPDAIKNLAPTIGSLLQLAADHEFMHVGQYTPVRRKLGKPMAF